MSAARARLSTLLASRVAAPRALASGLAPRAAAVFSPRFVGSAPLDGTTLEDLREAIKLRNLWEVNRVYDALATDPTNLRSLTPDDIGAILSLQLKAAVPERVNKLLEDVSSAGIRPALGEYNTYVAKNAARGGWVYSDAAVFLDAMRKRGVKPDAETYKFLIAALIQEGDAWGAKKLRDYEQAVDSVPADAQIYTSLIRGLAEQGDLEAAKEVAEDMLEANIRPDPKLLQQTVEELMQKGLNDIALDLVNELAVGEEAVVETGSGGSRP